MIVEDRLDTLVRARVAMTARRPKPEQISRALRPFAPDTMSESDWRTRVAASFDRSGDEVPPWKRLVEKSIPCEMLGVDEVNIRSRDGWASAIVGRSLGLWTAGPPPKLKTLCDILVWRELGLATKPRSCPEEIRALFAQRALGTSDAGKADRHVRVLAAKMVRAARPETKLLREALVRMWLVGGTLGGSFTDDVRRIAQTARDGVFGDRKVFISAAWRQLARLPAWSTLTLDDFKRRVLAAHHAGDLELARADLVGAMDPELVHTSETIGDGARFHFLVREMS